MTSYDAVEWFNQKHISIDPSCKKLDLRNEIRKGMEHDMWV